MGNLFSSGPQPVAKVGAEQIVVEVQEFSSPEAQISELLKNMNLLISYEKQYLTQLKIIKKDVNMYQCALLKYMQSVVTLISTTISKPTVKLTDDQKELYKQYNDSAASTNVETNNFLESLSKDQLSICTSNYKTIVKQIKMGIQDNSLFIFKIPQSGHLVGQIMPLVVVTNLQAIALQSGNNKVNSETKSFLTEHFKGSYRGYTYNIIIIMILLVLILYLTFINKGTQYIAKDSTYLSDRNIALLCLFLFILFN